MAMSQATSAFQAAVRAALAAPEDGALAGRFPAPLVTALVADSSEPEPRLAEALGELTATLASLGVPRGRQLVLLGGDPVVADAPARAQRLAARLGLPVLVHAPEYPGFVAGRLADGTPLELDDELREAEGVLCVGRGFAAAGRVVGGPYLLVPGVASARTRLALAGARARGGERAALEFALAAEVALPVDLAVCWDEQGRVVAGRGRERFAALARAAGFA